MIYLRTTDRQTVNYNSTNHALELTYFDSIKTINDETTFEVFSFFQLSAIALKISRKKFDCFENVYMYLLRLSSVKTMFHRLPPLVTSHLITFQWQSKAARAFRTVTLLFHITRCFNFGYIGEVCSNRPYLFTGALSNCTA